MKLSVKRLFYAALVLALLVSSLSMFAYADCTEKDALSGNSSKSVAVATGEGRWLRSPQVTIRNDSNDTIFYEYYYTKYNKSVDSKNHTFGAGSTHSLPKKGDCKTITLDKGYDVVFKASGRFTIIPVRNIWNIW